MQWSEVNAVIPHLMHTSLDALPHLMHTKSVNKLGSSVNIIKFKECMHIHLMHTENFADPMFDTLNTLYTLHIFTFRFCIINHI